MNPNDDHKDTTLKKKAVVEFQYFIESAIQKKLPWNTLAYFLMDLAPDLDKSKEVIKILVQELEKWVQKVENDCSPQIQPLSKNNAREFENEIQDHLETQSDLEMPSSDDEKIDDDFSEITEVNINNHKIHIQIDPSIYKENNLEWEDLSEFKEIEKGVEENVQEEENDEILLDKIGYQFYEFIGSDKDKQNDNEIPKGSDYEKLGVLSEPDTELEVSDIKEKSDLKCKYCSKIFTKKSALERHEMIHSAETPFKCTTCDKNFNRRDNLKSHEQLHIKKKTLISKSNEIKKLQCYYCKKYFAKNSKLIIHERIHTGEKPYQCNSCDKCFISPSGLNRHEKIHNADKPYQCTSCSKCFKISSHLKKHKRIHSSKKPFQCTRCNKCFENLSEMEKHELVHRGGKPHQCIRCDKTFSKPSYLKLHERTHTDEKPFQCEICNTCFTSSRTLRRHHKNLHMMNHS